MLERERKFKLKFMPKDTAPALVIRQAYLMLSDGKQLRVRITQTDDITVSYICYKASVSGSQTDKNEFEYQIPNEDAIELFNSTDLQLNKIRYSKSLGFSHADIDIYPNGLEIVEIETPENVTLNELPDFCGEEITGIKEYSNIYLALQNESAVAK